MHGTVKDNILFFADERPEDLNEAVDCCELCDDLKTLSHGMNTEIGERGVNLSGGQKARISLARAVYSKRKFFLLDDPLSAVDAHVAERIMTRCILGSLRGTTRVLVTHQLQFLCHADYIVSVRVGGTINFVGTYAEYLTWSRTRPTSPQPQVLQTHPEEGPSTGTAASSAFDASDERKGEQPPRELQTLEEKATGGIPWRTYRFYLHSAGGWTSVTWVLLVFVLSEMCIVASNVWLSLWSERSFDLSQDTYLVVFTVIVLLGSVGAAVRPQVIYRFSRRASFSIHHALLSSVVSAPISFFDATPTGRIINRFSQDLDRIDNNLSVSYLSALQCAFSLISSLAVLVVSQPFIIVVLLPAVFGYYKATLFFSAANREIERVNSINKSPLFILLSEILSGMKTIAAYGRQRNYLESAANKLEAMFSSSFLSVMANRWLAIRLEAVALGLVTAAATVAVVMKLSGLHVNTAIASLGMTTSAAISYSMNFLVRYLASVESDMNAIERALHYIDAIPHEKVDIGTSPPATATLESKFAVQSDMQSICVRGLCLRYREGLPLVLRSLSFNIGVKEHVGVVGRTGSGKSTLFLALLRMVEPCGGDVLVNGVDTQTITLPSLRSMFSIIPQDPVLFDGTVRSNLDPFHEHDNAALWAVITRVGLEARIRQDKKHGLDGSVIEGGKNFSVGQRQLLCMARALLKRTAQYILMDEATANIDTETDSTLQQTIRNEFQDRVVITIAHRLRTVLDYHKIIVMDEGRVVEMGSPRQLAEEKGSVFRAMIAAQGPAEEEALMSELEGYQSQPHVCCDSAHQAA